MKKFYNPEIKEKFLDTYDNEQTKTTIGYVFFASEASEDILGKDLYDFTTEEIGKVIKDMSPHSANVAASTGRFISNYISYAMKYRKSNIHPLKGLDTDFYSQFVDKTRKIHYSESEFNDLLENMLNAQDQAFLRLMFEGISMDELTTLKKSDINWDDKTITVTEKEETRTLEVSDILLKYLEKAIDQKTYFLYNPEKKEHKEAEVLESDFVFRNTKSARAIEGKALLPNVFYKRLNLIKEEFEVMYLTPNALKQSGQIKMAADIINEKLSNGQEPTLEYDDFAKIGERYKASKIVSPNYSYFNSTLMRQYISEDNLKDLYNIHIK